MAMQENITVSHPSFATENSGLRLVEKKDRQKEQEELLNLATVLKALEKELKGARGKATNAPAEASSGPGDAEFGDAMAEMAFALQMLQVKINEYGQKKAGYNNNIAQAEVTAATKNLEKLQKELKKIASKEKHQKQAALWMKIGEVVVAAVAAVVAVVTLQPELLVITVLSLASASGVFKEITKGVAKLLELCGVPSKVAEISAAVIVAVCATVAAAACADPEQAIDSTAEAGEEIGTEAVATGTDVGEAATSETGMMEKMQTVLGKVQKANPFRKLSPRTNMALFAGTQTISQTGLVSSVMNMVMESKTLSKHLSKEKKEEIEMALNIALTVASMIVGIGTGAAMMEGAGAKTTVTDMSSLSAKFVSKAPTLNVLASLGQGAAGATEGSYTVEQAKLEGSLATIRACLQLVNETVNENSNEMAQDQQNRAQTLKGEKTGARTIASLMNGMAGFAQLFTEYSPV